MKKSLVALAVLAASGASFAQSAVTVYGVVDAWVGSVKNDNGATSTSVTQLGDGGVSPSRWGLKGSEDLGGGLKANFNLEQGFSLDTGAAGNAALAFSRQSWVGFSGGFGEVRLGRMTTAFDDVGGSADAVFDSALSPANNGVFISGGYTGRPNNGIFYQAPSMGGFSGAVSYSLAEDANGVPAGALSVTSLNLTYGNGPLALQLGYQVDNVNNQVNDTAYTRLGGSYNLGVATIMASYGKVTNVANVSGADVAEWQFGLDYSVSSNLTVSASYARSNDNVTAGDFKRDGLGFGASYSLSKRTSVYGGYESDKISKAGTNDVKHSLMAVGIRHAF
ncbi:porin [Rhodoferax sp.]|uniref:porin n=1 Tax=Rhodoferax sp. TaxID=50421 RepID=UPI0026097317|nr:porin [Rhodoferax sp.]MDD2811675.1 porin [Rhodoferax sp.]